jgi:hypothetical protein
MEDRLILQECQPLPLRFDDGALGELELRHGLEALSPSDRLFLLYEARRVLRADGVLRLVLPAAGEEAAIFTLARQIGLDAAPARLAAAGEEPGTKILSFKKPDRRVSGRPLVSLLIPAYSPRFFEECLASAIRQTYENLEIIVCDDSPGQEIERISQRLALVRPVDYVRNSVRLHGRGNYAKCFSLASGEFVKYLNDDDVLIANCVERLVDAFRQAPDVVLATSYRQRIDEAGATLADQPATRPLLAEDMIVNGVTLANIMIMAGLNVIGEPTTTLFRRDDLKQAIPDDFQFDSQDSFGIVDMAMWAPLLLKGNAAYFRDGLSRFRIHAQQQQHDPSIREPTVRSIRNLQAKWLALGLHTRFSRDALLVRSFPDQGLPWRVHRFAPFGQSPPARLWRYC